jgi:hypothetical protein
MIVFGVVWIIVCSKMPEREPFRANTDGKSAGRKGKSDSEKKIDRNQRRKLRKKLQ